MPRRTSTAVAIFFVVLCSLLVVFGHSLHDNNDNVHDDASPPPSTAPPPQQHEDVDFDLNQAVHIATVFAQPLPQELLDAERSDQTAGLGTEKSDEPPPPTTKFWLQFRVDQPTAMKTPTTPTTETSPSPTTPQGPILNTTSLILDMVLEPNEHFLSRNYEEVIHIKQPRRSLNATDPNGVGPMTQIEVPPDKRYLPTLRRVQSCVYNGYLFDPQALSPIHNSMVSITTCAGSIKGWVRTPTGQYYSVENNAELQDKYNKRYTDPAIKAMFKQYKKLAQAGDIEELIRLVPTVHLVDANRESAHEAKKDGNGDVFKQHEH